MATTTLIGGSIRLSRDEETALLLLASREAAGKLRNREFVVSDSEEQKIFWSAYGLFLRRVKNASRHREAYRKNPQKFNLEGRVKRLRLKKEVIEHYGGKCVCCKEEMLEFLTLDHVNGDGWKYRKEDGISSGNRTYYWAKRNNFPDCLQVMCWNCNEAKQIYGVCPHNRTK